MSAATPIKMYPVVNNPQRITGGYYLKAKCIQNSAIAHAAPHVREIWDHLLKEANYADRKTFGTIIKRGQLFTDYNEIIEALTWKEGFVRKSYKKHHVDYAMRWLRQEAMITTEKTTRGLIVTVCKYEYYQNSANYEKDTDYDTPTVTTRQTTRQTTPITTQKDDVSNSKSTSNKEKDGNGYDSDKDMASERQAATITKELKELKENTGADAPPKPKSFKQLTEKEFYNQIAEYKNQFPKEMLREFFDSWSEKTPSGKMKFQLRDTWELKKRLDTWQRNDERWNRKGKTESKEPEQQSHVSILKKL